MVLGLKGPPYSYCFLKDDAATRKQLAQLPLMEFLVLVIEEEGLVVILEVVVVVFLTFTSLISFASKVVMVIGVVVMEAFLEEEVEAGDKADNNGIARLHRLFPSQFNWNNSHEFRFIFTVVHNAWAFVEIGVIPSIG
ncbi:hypothetical protein DAPPUDRAFT_110885 [Daphnia pulex]|uniref:Uncharacterized protein n=1 Tax=Daphnia pulex TaxID=6669 RepID=E9H7F9_DAPPU|nr:hypothetical protein DAPPUDRAFT_110885 [Daphnia pulex]|eukprot:EFX72370.1 hypothetical protein DAPPUDRAFT_110885 [Daphnia pulex]